MSSTLLEALRDQYPVFDSLSDVCRTRTMPLFLDLCWGDSFDVNAALDDPGIQLDMNGKQFVLMRVNDEIRYYAGPLDPAANDYPQEIGILTTEAAAVAYAYDYLVKRLPFSEIKVDRIVWSRNP